MLQSLNSGLDKQKAARSLGWQVPGKARDWAAATLRGKAFSFPLAEPCPGGCQTIPGHGTNEPLVAEAPKEGQSGRFASGGGGRGPALLPQAWGRGRGRRTESRGWPSPFPVPPASCLPRPHPSFVRLSNRRRQCASPGAWRAEPRANLCDSETRMSAPSC